MASRILAHRFFASLVQRVLQAWIPLWLLLACVVAQAGCSCSDSGQVPKRQLVLPCKSQGARIPPALALPGKTTVPGATTASFAIGSGGDATLSMRLHGMPSHLESDLLLSYSSAAGEGVLGVGFSLSGASAITRCPKTMAIDGEVRAVQYDADDALCMDGKRLVVVSQNADVVEYRTFPDTHVKVIGHFEDASASYFEAFLPSGHIVEYGKTSESRPMALGGVPRAWLATEERDARGNAIEFGYCFAEDPSGYVAEYALQELRHTAVDRTEPTSTVALVYGVKDDVRTVYSSGMTLQQSLQLDEARMYGPANELARRYEFDYEQSEAAVRTLLASVEECGADGACKPPTRFHYASVETGFEDVTTTIEAPLSKQASPMLANFSGSGVADLLIPDTTAQSTSTNPITEWRVARNQGNGFAASKVAFLQEWSFQQEPAGPADPSQIQPELGTVIDYNQDGKADVLLHDVYGNRNNHMVLISKADGAFEALDTGIERPFPLGPAPKQLRSAGGSVHLADADGDGVQDLIQCSDHGDTIDTANVVTWELHAWRPGGFEPNGTVVPTLAGIDCAIEMHTIDTNHDGVTDLLVPGVTRVGGAVNAYTGTYSVHRRYSDGTWVVFDTRLRTPSAGGRTLFADVNGDGLPDAITSGYADGRLRTHKNIGKGFVEDAQDSLEGDGTPIAQDKYFHLASSADFDGDGRADILLPMVDAISPNIPRWVILRAIGDGTFERIESGIPFEAALGNAVTLADPRGPRIGDLNGDGVPDVAIFLGNRLHIFKNRAADPDVLVGLSDGMNEHEPDEPGFIPNVSIKYGHLTDVAKMEGRPAKETDLYLSQSDSSNGCAYPRHCAVGSKRVVREYAVSDGQGGQRRYGLRYRDGRYDRLGHGFLGFGKRIVTDLDTGASTAEFYDNVTKVKIGGREVYPFARQVQRQWHWAPGLPTQPNPKQVELAFAERTIDVVPTNGGASYFTLPTKMHSRRLQGTFSGAESLEAYVQLVESVENATMLRDSTVEVLDYDEYGNVLKVDVSTVGVDLTTHITRTVKNDVAWWILGQPLWQEECSSAAGVTQCRTVTRTTNAFGEVETESTSSSDGIDDTKLTVVYERDKFGNVTSVKADDAFGHHRESTTVYDADGIYPTKYINGLGDETVVEYDTALGVLLKEVDPNQLTTEWVYDSLGRLETEKHPDGSHTTITRMRERIDGLWRLKERSTTTGGADDETVFDSLGRPVRTYTHGPSPKANTPRIMQVFEYDRLSGQVAKRSVPIAEGTPASQLQWETYAFDALGREIRHTTPWNATTTTSYNGLLVDSTDPLLNHTITQIDALGRPITITDAANGQTKYTYGPFSTLQAVTDPGNAITKWTRDAFGRLRQVEQPDRGTTTFINNGFGDLVSSTDALGRVVTFGMDALGRTTTRTDTHAGKNLTTTWTWDTAAHGKGRLHSVTSPDGVKTYSYSDRGQMEKMTLAVGGETFTARMAYDHLGRPKSLEYPWPLGEEPFGVTYEYDNHGYRLGVRDTYTNVAYWQLTDVDEAGRYKGEAFGNGVTTARSYHGDKEALKSITTTKGAATLQQLSYDWDERLNLKSRTDALQATNKTERFRYDALSRLTCAYYALAENANASCATSYGYAPNGNLTSKSDVGALSYADAKHPHAVTNVPGESFFYDAVGNQIARPGGTTITYTPFDLPKTITQPGKAVSFGYDGDERRIRKTTPTTETLYFGDLFEQVKSGNAKAHRYYVQSPERVVAIVTRGGNAPGTAYLHVDHLGSTESVTNEKGEPVEKRSYDAFGQRRNVVWGLPPPPASFTSKVTKGFTGHEEADEFGLVDMRGRFFDPRIGRFLSTDPIIASVYNGQSFGAYSYVRNNPLTLVDPSGFTEEEARRLWRVEETPGQLGIHITFDQLPPPTPRPTPSSQAGDVGAQAPTTDVGTTGNGAAGPPQGATVIEKGNMGDAVWDGVGDAARGAWSDMTTPIWDTALEMHDAYDKGDAIDAFNVVNPLIAAANISLANDNGDTYSVTRQSTAIGVTVIVGVIVGKVIGGSTGAGKGGKTTRGPPKPGAAETPHYQGPRAAPDGASPNSIWETNYPNGNRRVTYFDERGMPFSREDYGQQARHIINVDGQRINLKHTPHEHQTRMLDGPNGPYPKNQVRTLDQNGSPTSGWINEK